MSKKSKKVENSLVTVVDKTPFRVIETEKGHIITVGNQLSTEETFKTLEDAIERIERMDWELICSTMYVYVENMLNKLKNKQS